MNKTDSRIQNEIKHGKFLKEHGAGEIWNWESAAGKSRWARRVGMLTAHLKKEMHILEVGCGTGYFTKELVKKCLSVVAIDISEDLLEIARQQIMAPNVTFLRENAYALTFEDCSFDSIVGSSVLHHLEIDRALQELHRVLKLGGTVFFTEPNMLNPQIALQKNIPYIKRKMGDSPDETAFFRWNLKNKFVANGFKNPVITPFDFVHPSTPRNLLAFMDKLGSIAEKIPLLSEIAGSLYIRATK